MRGGRANPRGGRWWPAVAHALGPASSAVLQAVDAMMVTLSDVDAHDMDMAGLNTEWGDEDIDLMVAELIKGDRVRHIRNAGTSAARRVCGLHRGRLGREADGAVPSDGAAAAGRAASLPHLSAATALQIWLLPFDPPATGWTAGSPMGGPSV